MCEVDGGEKFRSRKKVAMEGGGCKKGSPMEKWAAIIRLLLCLVNSTVSVSFYSGMRCRHCSPHPFFLFQTS